MTTSTANQKQNPAFIGIIIAWGTTEIVKAIAPFFIMAFKKTKHYLTNKALPAIKAFIKRELPIITISNIKDSAMRLWVVFTAKVQEAINK